MEQIAGVEIYPVISLIIFFTFFSLVTYLVITSDKKQMDEISRMPLDAGDNLHNDNNHENLK